jgi:hypothetical protein
MSEAHFSEKSNFFKNLARFKKIFSQHWGHMG